MLIAQISDLHIGYDRDNPHEMNVRRLNFVIDRLNDMRPRADLLLVTGDLVENGDDIGAYRHMHALVGRFEGPALFIAGNHDDRDRLRAVMPFVETDADGFLQYEAAFGGLRLLMLDTIEPGRHGGAYCRRRAAWLKKRLAEQREVPTLIVLHHPPVDNGIEWMSADPAEQWVARLERVIAPARQVKALLAGHVHRPIAATFAGKPLLVCPSTAPPIALDLDPFDPARPDHRPLIMGDAPGFALHLWDGQRLLSHFDIAGPRNVLASYDSNLQPMIRDFLAERGTG